MSSVTLSDFDWPSINRLVDKVHRHVRGHASISDFKMILTRNDFSYECVEGYLIRTVEKCSSYRRLALTRPNRKVSLSSMNSAFNEVV